MADDTEADGDDPSFSSEEIRRIRRDLGDWYERHRRDLPWRGIDDPYRTWVAEVMLQQTQVATVVDYYRRWMERFPDVESLAEADRDEVMELWEGLGYYRRARFLHRSSRLVVEDFDGELPGSVDELEELPGVGPYTAGAIASIAFEEPVPVVDGNVSRVLSRLRAIPGDPTSTDNEKAYWRLAERLVDPDEPGDFNQAMMELGATVCTAQSPACLICPVREECRAFQEGRPEAYPDTASRATQKPVTLASALVGHVGAAEQKVWVARRPPDGMLGGLWEFPTVEVDDDDDPCAEVASYLRENGIAEIGAPDLDGIDQFVHHFSHRRLTVHVYTGFVDESDRGDLANDDEAGWLPLADLEGIGMSTVMRRVERAVRESDDAPRFEEG